MSDAAPAASSRAVGDLLFGNGFERNRANRVYGAMNRVAGGTGKDLPGR